jgi:PAS domain S-box-containing protein
MREREAQLSLLLDTAMDAILVLDGEFRITRLNPRATELFACTEEDLAGESFLGRECDRRDQPQSGGGNLRRTLP